MIIKFDDRFQKQYKKLSVKLQNKVDIRIELFAANPSHPLLRNHALKGKYLGYSSINITGDYRALYTREGDEIIIFALVGTHSQLYG